MPVAVSPFSQQAKIGTGYLAPGVSNAAEALGRASIRSVERFLSSSQAVPYFYRQRVMPVIFDPDDVVNDILTPTLDRLEHLATWEDGWNGYDAPAPDEMAIAQARRWIKIMLIAAVSIRGSWKTPNVTGGSEGEVVFEWWQGKRKLTVYVSADDVEYVQVWGADTATEMADGPAEKFQDLQAIWLWLTGE
jgi:hypothetical protein